MLGTQNTLLIEAFPLSLVWVFLWGGVGVGIRSLVAQVGLEPLTFLLYPPNAGITDMHHHAHLGPF